MLKKISFILFIGLALPLFAAESIPVKEFSEWQVPKDWKIESGQLEYPFTKWSSVSTSLDLRKGGIYRLSFEYHTPGAVSTPLKISIGKKVAAAYPPVEKRSRASVFFHAEDDGACPLAFLAEGKAPYTLWIENVKLDRLEDGDLQKITFNADDGPTALRNMKGEPVQIVEDTDHIDEGAAFICRGKEEKALRSIEVPVQPGKKYSLSFWAKGTPGMFYVSVDGGWVPNTKHWNARQSKRVSEKWAKYTLDFTYPTAEEYSYLKRRLAGCQFQIPAAQTEFLLKNITFEQVP